VQQNRVAGLVRALRPTHWVKNVFVLAPLVFSQRLSDPDAVAAALQAFGVFCVLSSTVYLINDIADREADSKHSKKKNRPIASGVVPVWLAAAVAAVLGVGGLAWAWTLGPEFALIACFYLVMNLAYSLALKRVVIVDVMLVAAGFLLRAWGGAVVIGVVMSKWLILCTGLIALFLGFVKRRQEIAGTAGSHETRPILREYSLPFLDQMIAVVTSSTVLAYALYAFDPSSAERLGTRHMGLTLPFVLFGIFRYLYLVHQRGEGDNPTTLVLSDIPLLLNVVLWAAAVVVAIYVWP
jgi:4-hydroxybenzoate polyprenyltransferase